MEGVRKGWVFPSVEESYIRNSEGQFVHREQVRGGLVHIYFSIPSIDY